ncbi:2-carboxy-1,4-naphthoquinone phytyltransferase, chloroplastic [Sesamum angolense]|uniref:2-carboxy-1,4-naphthoquinone phytyltransferase, chloroplastic n=1 Tax=Sesamum angolense TaxID=2727404 RepID=A0AAE2BXZ7_9LAMI|nr:2-carboxy-1,4-naphthoquinone phytyltransferase, chloroplastic [Sesamum angolense]
MINPSTFRKYKLLPAPHAEQRPFSGSHWTQRCYDKGSKLMLRSKRENAYNGNLVECSPVQAVAAVEKEAKAEEGEEVSRATLIWRAFKLPMYTVAFTPVTVGSAVAYWQTGLFSFGRYFALLASYIIVIAWVNLSNDVYDFDTGADKNKKESMVNLFGSRTAINVIAWSLLVLGVLGLSLVALKAGNPRSMMFLAAAIFGFYLYQCPPFRLSYHGVGEPLLFISFGPFSTIPFYLLHSVKRELPISSTVIWASVLVGLTTSLILFCSHFHQIEDDKAVGKMSPLVRLGTEKGSLVVKWSVIGLYSLLFALGFTQTLPFTSVLLSALTLPMANLIVSFVQKNHMDSLCLLGSWWLECSLNSLFHKRSVFKLRSDGDCVETRKDGCIYGRREHLLPSFDFLLCCAIATCDSSYDYSASIQCLAEPLDPQYGGGLVGNPNFDSGLDEWSVFGGGKVAVRKSKKAWLQLDKGKDIVSAFLEIPNGQSKNTQVELWIDNVSLKPFTRIEWQQQQNKSIDRIRKRKIREFITAGTIINHKAYQDWFTSRFTATTFNNEMKWYYTELYPGKENYTVTDAMVSFFKKNRIAIRGHAILWAAGNVTQPWVKILPPKEILKAAVRRMGSVVSRYLGDVIAWDVMNENLHYSFYEEKIRPNATSMFYQIARALDPQTPLFLNEYNTLEFPLDMAVIPSKYVEKIREIRSFPGNERLKMQIGLQGHFWRKPNVSHMRATLDVLGAINTPIWLTELDTKRGPNQAAELEEVMREAFSHPAVEGIIVWGGWKPTGCNQTCLTDKNYEVLPKGCAEMCLIDNNFKNLPAGDVVDKLINEWKTTNVTGVTDGDGVFEHKVFLGDYSVTYSHPLIPRPVKKYSV